MNRTTFTQAKKTPGKFGDRTGVFQKHINNEMRTLSVSLSGRAKQALELLIQAEDRGLTQRVTLALDPTFWRLAATIGVLRDKGFLIRTHRVHRADGRWHARYELMGVAEGAQR